MRSRSEALSYAAHRRRVCVRTYNLTLSLLSRHISIPTARNCTYGLESLHRALIHLSAGSLYAEGGLADLASTASGPITPSADTFPYRLKLLQPKEAFRMLMEANDEALKGLRALGTFRRKAMVAIDYTYQPYYGDPNAPMVVAGKHQLGTNWFYAYASLHIIEAGRRITVYTKPIHAFSCKAEVVEELIRAAWARGVHIALVLSDRAFFTVEVIDVLQRLKVRFLMPAVKNDAVRASIKAFHDGELGSVSKFTLGEGDHKAVFSLLIHPKPVSIDEAIRKRIAIHDRYIAFATNLSKQEALRLYRRLPEDYRRRWGIETGFRVQGGLEAKTTSRCYVVRLLYHMVSVILYNVWQLANLLLARKLRRSLTKPLMRIKTLTLYFQILTLDRPKKPG